MIYMESKKFNENNVSELTKGEWLTRTEIYEILNALDEYACWLERKEIFSEERENFQETIKQKLNTLLTIDLHND